MRHPGFQYQLNPTAGGLELVALTKGTATSAVQAPTLDIERFVPHVVVSWAAPTSDYILQSSTDLKAGTWTNRTTAHRLFVPDPTGSEFFRLSKP